MYKCPNCKNTTEITALKPVGIVQVFIVLYIKKLAGNMIFVILFRMDLDDL
jgi:hypothetical protein